MIAPNILKQLMIPEYHMGNNYKGGSMQMAVSQYSTVTINDYEIKNVFERKQCFRADVSNIGFHELLLQNPWSG